METKFKTLGRTIALAAVAGVLLAPMMIKNAMAEGEFCNDNLEGSVCPAGQTCCSSGETCDLENNVCEAPEMSDYLAMAFVVVASGMIYRIRRRSLAEA